MLSKKEYLEMLNQRHTPQIQEKLTAGKVAVAGLGGLGSHVAIGLARIGVGNLHLVDFDTVEPSNLNRQSYKIADLGKEKTLALKEEIQEINPYINVYTHTVQVTAKNATKLFAQEDIICEAFDNPIAKAMLVNTILEQSPHTKIVASSGMAGFESSNEIHTKKIRNNFYLCGDGKNGIESGMGLMAPRVMVCAGHQGNMIVRLLLNTEHA
ncbi:MAG: thiamine biosynthesis protein ThiF [Clostridiales bacterium]